MLRCDADLVSEGGDRGERVQEDGGVDGSDLLDGVAGGVKGDQADGGPCRFGVEVADLA